MTDETEKLKKLDEQILQKEQKLPNNQRKQKANKSTFISYCPRCKQQHMFFDYRCMTCGLPYDSKLRKINTKKAIENCGIPFHKDKIICIECKNYKTCIETKNEWNGQEMQ